MDRKNNIVPIWEKLTLSIEEASAYSGIGRDALYRLCEQEERFVLRIGNRRRIKRKEFENFISGTSDI